MSSTPSPAHEVQSVSAEALAEAASRRVNQLTDRKTTLQLAAEHERRQVFRRLIDPGITRPNSKEQAASSIKTLLTIAENLLQEPDNEKYRRFKTTNAVIQRELMKPKGAVEYAIEMGFRPQVKDFQPYYVFHPRYMEDLYVGARILRDHINLENEKAERVAYAKANEKANAEAAAERVRLAFMDDRRTKMMRDDMEKEQRAARATAGAQSPHPPRGTASSAPSSTLQQGNPEGRKDPPPPYSDEDED